MIRINHPWGHGPWRTEAARETLEGWCDYFNAKQDDPDGYYVYSTKWPRVSKWRKLLWFEWRLLPSFRLRFRRKTSKP